MPRLRRSDPNGPGLRRVRAGSGFSYRDEDDRRLTDASVLARIDALVIPPAWSEVWITSQENGHIQATGVDAAGRRQYLYHPAWRERKDKAKFTRALALAESLPSARRQVTIDLRSEGLSRERVLAAGFRMLDVGSLRVGSERYAKSNGSFGLTTLLCSHASASGESVRLRFPAKSGHAWESDIVDGDLAAVVKLLLRREPNAHLLSYRDGTDWHPVSAAELGEYIRERTGGDFTAKDFRTLHGTVVAAVSLASQGREKKRRARASAISRAMRDVAAELGNTPAVARRSYVDPRVLRAYQAGKTIDPRRSASAESELRMLLAPSGPPV
jgi:DNA topoisomerase I